MLVLFPQLLSELGNELCKGMLDGIFLQFAFPDYVNVPAVGTQRLQVARIALHVAFEFGNPIFLVGFGHGGVAVRAAMPKAAVDHDTYTLSRPGHIGFPRRFPLQAVAVEARFAKPLAHDEFRLGVFAFVAAHAVAHRLGNGGKGARRGGEQRSGRFAEASGQRSVFPARSGMPRASSP